MKSEITSVKFYDEFTGDGGGGVFYPNQRPLDKTKVIIEGFFKWSTEGKRLLFDSATKTITRDTGIDFGSFLDDGFQIGDLFLPQDTASNNTTKTIATVTDSVITTVEALVTETAEDASLFGTTPVDNIDFYFNVIPNDAQENYLSMTDKNNIQKLSYSGFDCTDVGVPKDLVVQGDSIGWWTGLTSTIEGAGNADFTQAFKIILYYHQAPFALRDQIQNFLDRRAPDYLYGGNSLQFVFLVNGKFDPETTDVPHPVGIRNLIGNVLVRSTGGIKGVSVWYDKSTTQRTAPYTPVSIVYKDMSDVVIARPDINTECKVTAIIKAENDTFTAGSKLILQFIHLPRNESDYVDTQTNLAQNFLFDRKLFTVGAASSNGDNYGTDAQVLTTITSSVSGDEITVNFHIDFSASIKAFLQGANDEDRYYAIVITTQDPDITTTAEADRTAVIMDVQNMDYNKDDASLLELQDYIRCFHFPNRGTEPANNIVGYPNDPIYVNVPFLVEKNSTLMSAGCQIIATKDGEDDFIIEEKSFNTSNVRFLLDGDDNPRQDIEMKETRGFVTYKGDFYNEVSLRRAAGYDTGSMTAFMLFYGFVLRYESWREIVPVDEAADFDIFRSIEDVSQDWSKLPKRGWVLIYRFKAAVKGSDGHITDFYADTTITLKALDEVGNPAFTCDTKYYDSDDVEIASIEKDAVTKIVATFSGDFSALPSPFTAPSGYIAIDLLGQGSIFLRRMANPEFPSEDGSPFSSEGIDADPEADESYAKGNARIDIFNYDKIVISTLYDDTVDGWSARGASAIIYPGLKFKGATTDCPLLSEETGIPILAETGFAELNEEC